MSPWPRLYIVLAVAAAPPAAACTLDEVADLLVGEWVAGGEGREVHERWTRASADTLEGAGYTVHDGTIGNPESLRLVSMLDGIYYIAKVGHNAVPVAFTMESCMGGRLVFVNPEHDFPRRLQYIKEADGRLVVHISDGAARGFTLNFEPAPAGPGS